MKTIAAIKARRSVKHFDANYQISEDEVTKLLSLAALSLTAFNIQHWRFVVVKDSDLRGEIRKVSWNQAQVTDSSLLIILCADLKAWENL
jgi:nitroreductase